MITVSVPGKVHLMGEHAVVYGKPALLAAINLRMSVSVEKHDRLEIVSSEPTDYAEQAVSFLANTYKLKETPRVRIYIDSKIPAGYHLGSSAAVAVGVTGAFTYFIKKIWNPMAINQLAYEIEKFKHGNPSGGDNTAVTMGGFIWFRKELEFLRSIWQMPMKTTLTNFFLIDTGRPAETTGDMVAYVKSQADRNPVKFSRIFEENEVETKRIAVALKTGDEETLLSAITNGERSLERMGVVSKKAALIIREIERTGGAAKILGGGGRKDGAGFLLCYTKHPPKNALPIVLGEEGIRLESKT